MIECGVSYFGVRRLEHVKRDLDNILEHGATYVVHMLSENDWRYYSKTMREIVLVTEKAGLSAWIDPVSLGQVFGGEEFGSDFVALHPEAAQVDQYGNQLPAACMNQAVFQEYLKDWISAAVDTGAKTILWDEPHMFIGSWFGRPGHWGCRCKLCQDLFEAKYHEIMPVDENDQRVLQFKSDTMLKLLADALTKAHQQGAANVVTLIPEEFTGTGRLRWEDIAMLEWIDSLGTDPYPFPSFPNQESLADRWKEYVGSYTSRLVSLCADRMLNNHLWVQGFSVPADDKGYLSEVMDLAVSLGIRNIGVWGFDGHRDMSAFACEDPDRAWNLIGKGFHRMRDV